jgi:hypothetical protein
MHRVVYLTTDAMPSKIETPGVGVFAVPAPLTSPLDHRQNGGNIRCWRLWEFVLLDGIRPKLLSPPDWLPGLLPQEIGALRYSLSSIRLARRLRSHGFDRF